MQDVARKAGVHAATVSRALGNRGGVSADVRAKIQQVASALGYRPNPLVSALIRSRRNPHRSNYHATLGFLTQLGRTSESSHRSDCRRMIAGALRRAAAFGYRVEEFNLGVRGMSSERFSQVIAARNLAGLILPPLYSVHDTIAVDWKRFPVVAIGYSQRIPVPRVAHNHPHAMELAMAKCREHGCRHIGLVLPRRVSEKVENRWLAAYLHDQFQQGRTAPSLPPLLLEESCDDEAFATWFAANRPDAIIGLPHFTPLGQWLKAAGRRVPRDVALVSLDCRGQGPKYTGIYQDFALLGAVAVEQLVGLVERNDQAMIRRASGLVIDGVWRDGATLGPARR